MGADGKLRIPSAITVPSVTGEYRFKVRSGDVLLLAFRVDTHAAQWVGADGLLGGVSSIECSEHGDDLLAGCPN